MRVLHFPNPNTVCPYTTSTFLAQKPGGGENGCRRGGWGARLCRVVRLDPRDFSHRCFARHNPLSRNVPFLEKLDVFVLRHGAFGFRPRCGASRARNDECGNGVQFTTTREGEHACVWRRRRRAGHGSGGGVSRETGGTQRGTRHSRGSSDGTRARGESGEEWGWGR